MSLEIVTYPDPRLTEKAEDIPAPGPELDKLVERMFNYMKQSNGIGLAAPQIGLSLRLFVADPELTGGPKAFIDPQIVRFKKERLFEEACLSMPGVRGYVRRYSWVIARAYDSKGEQFELEAEKVAAALLQHETDHLNGKLFPYRMSSKHRRMIQPQLDRLEEAFHSSDEEEAHEPVGS